MAEIVSTSEQLPYFKGTEYEDHVNAWLEVDKDVQERYWMLGAIAASLDKRYGEDVIGKFSSDVGSSKARIYQYRDTYRAWENYNRSEILSFKHHTIAGRHPEPQKVIETAEDEKLSTRELDEFVKTGELPNRDEVPQTEEVNDVDEVAGAYDVVEITRTVKVDITATAKFGDDSTHDLDRKALLKRGWKPEINITWRRVGNGRGSSPKDLGKNDENQR